MTRQVFCVESYWKVMVYYNVDYGLFDVIENDLKDNGADVYIINNVYRHMSMGYAKAMTYSNLDKKVSIVMFNEHNDMEDYINSIVHEAEHIKQAMLDVYDVNDEGEPPAYTVGYLVMRMWGVFKDLYVKS